MNKLNNNIVELITILEEKPEMLFLNSNDYNQYIAFINGFFLGLDMNSNLSISKDFSFWLGAYYQLENTNVHWTYFMKNRLEDKNDREKKINLLNLIKEFIKSDSVVK